MRRDPGALAATRFDLAIVGGGITGACLAFDAATRGMRVAVIDKGDFGAATSAASSKLLHGGLRYLQQLEPAKVRESALERIHLQNLAPHLTRYVPFLVPTYRGLARGKALLAAGMLAYEMLCVGQNRRVRHPTKRVPRGRWLSAAEVRALLPALDSPELTGGRLFYESHMLSSERMTWAFVQGAVRAGAVAVNYVRARTFLLEQGRVLGLRAVDETTGRELEVRARAVVNAAGPWIRQLNEQLGGRELTSVVTGFSRGAHLVTRALTGAYAVALPTDVPNQAVVNRGGRHVFVIPWRGRSLVGTSYGPHRGSLERVTPTDEEIDWLVSQVAAALGPGSLSRSDVQHAFAGLYPGTGHYQVVDHADADGIEGLFTVFGAKYTTARLLAERALDYIAGRLGGRFGPCRTRAITLPAGAIEDLDAFRARLHRRWDERIGAAAVEELFTMYGAEAPEMADRAAARPASARPVVEDRETLWVEIERAIDEEMTCHLEDVVFRRTGLGTVGDPGEAVLERVARRMGERHGWDQARRRREIERTQELFAR